MKERRLVYYYFNVRIFIFFCCVITFFITTSTTTQTSNKKKKTKSQFIGKPLPERYETTKPMAERNKCTEHVDNWNDKLHRQKEKNHAKRRHGPKIYFKR